MTAIDTNVLAPFEIWEVPLGKKTIKFFEPLILTPSIMPHDEEEPGDVEYLDVINDELNIDVFAKSRDELLSLIHSEIYFVWEHIVLQEDNKLDSVSKTIKRNHLAIAELIDG